MSLRRNILKTVAVSLMGIVLIAGAMTWALNSKWFLNIIVLKVINPSLKEAAIQKFETVAQSFYFPGQLILKGARLTVEQDQKTYAVECPYMHLENSSGIFASKKFLRFHAESCGVRADDWNVEGVDLNLLVQLKANQLEQITGEAKASAVQFGVYKANNAQTKIEYHENTLTLDEIFVYLYGGEMSGKISLENQPGYPYTMDIILKEVDLEKLEAAENNLLSQVKGKVNGHLAVLGQTSEISSIEGNLDIVEGGQMKASWLTFIISQLPPNSVQRKELDRLIKINGDFPFERFSVNSKSLNPEQMTSQVNIESKKFNLNLDYTIDTNIEGGLSNLLSYLKVFSNY